MTTAQIIDWPRSTSPLHDHKPVSAVPDLPRFGYRLSDIDVAGIADQIGMAGRPRREIIDRIRLLIDRAHFPLPKTPRFVAGKQKTGSDAVHAKSLWNRDQVHQWLDGTQPPAAVAARRQARRDVVRAQLGRNAVAMVEGAAA